MKRNFGRIVKVTAVYVAVAVMCGLAGCGSSDPEPDPIGSAKCPDGCSLTVSVLPIPLPPGIGAVDVVLIDRATNNTVDSDLGLTLGTTKFKNIDCGKKYRVEISGYGPCNKIGGGSGYGLWYGEGTISPQKCDESMTITLFNGSCF